MNAPVVWSRVLLVVGIAGMLIGAVDPIEGSILVPLGAGLISLGAMIRKNRHRVLLYWSFALVALGITAMVALSSLGGISGNTGRSAWWAMFVLPYPIGWIMGLVGSVLVLAESWKYHAPPKHGMKRARSLKLSHQN